MVKLITRFALGLTAITLAACQTYSPPADTASAPPSTSAAASTSKATGHDSDLAFIEAACGGCHAVEYPALSPNPAAPTFASIANREGLSEETLADWLADAHNYPEVMDFDLDPSHVEIVAKHMLTLRSEDYQPVE